MDVIRIIHQFIGPSNQRLFYRFLAVFLLIALVSYGNTICLFIITGIVLGKQADWVGVLPVKDTNQLLYGLCFLMTLGILAHEALEYFTQLQYLRFKESVRTQLATNYLTSILNMDVASYYQHNHGNYSRLCYNSSQNIVYLLHLGKEAAVALLTILLGVLLLVKVNGYILLGLGLLFVLHFARKFNRKGRSELTSIGFENENLTKRYTNYLDDVFHIFKEIRIFNRNDDVVKRATSFINFVSASNVVLNKQYIVGGNHLRSLLVVLILAGISGFHYFRIDIVQLIPTFLVVLVVLQRIVPSANAIHLFATHISTSAYLRKEWDEMSAYLSQPPRVAPTVNQFERITVEKARFGYAGKVLFDNLSFQLVANTITGVIGESGRGKTTFVELLAGLKDYDQACIRRDGQLVPSFDQLGILISAMSQKIYLMNDTLRNNLTLYNAAFDDAAIWAVLRQVNLESYFLQSADQLNVLIQKGGTNLSVGQAQRIGIARALLYQSKLLILDEFTASLDYENKMQIATLLQTLKAEMTIVITTHDKDILPFFDQTIDLS